ncbi:MAG: LuxR C-terminal-related transcriptional regulator, partial [Dehalococcoidia bacterium]
TYGHEEALEHFQRALSAKEGTPVDSETAALLFGLGRAQAATLQRQQIQEALASMTRALDYYLEAGDVEGAVAVVVYPLPPVTGPTENAHNIRRVLALVSPDSRQAAQLLSRYGWILGVEEGDFSGAQEAFNRALTIAQGGADAVLEEQTLAYAARVDAYNHSWEQSLGKSLQALELADRNDHTRNQLDACYRAAFSLHVMGDLQESALYAARAMDLAERLRDRYWLANALWINELVARLKGDWHGARTFSDRGLAIWPRDPRLLGTRVLLEYEVASFDQGQAYLERLMEIMRLTVPGPVLEYTTAAQVVPMIARITGAGSHLEVTERAAEAVLSSPSVTRGMANDIKGGLGLLAVHRGDTAGAEKAYAALESERGHLLFAAISGDRLLGLLCHTMSNPEQAGVHFEDALAFCRNGYRPELAWTCCDYADTLLRRNIPSDRRKATSLLDESLVISEELGMHPLRERVVALQEQTQSRPSRASEYPDSLTQREVEVLSAAAAGKTNPEIADELFISPHTVARHLTNIFAKTGTSSRAEASVYAAQHDLL